jgi:anti-anti-sigma regulatory factor
MYTTEEVICCRASLKGKLIRTNYDSLRNYLNRLLEFNESVIISFEAVEQLDMKCARLLLAVYHYAKSLNKRIMYISKSNPHIEQTLQNSGLTKLFSF